MSEDDDKVLHFPQREVDTESEKVLATAIGTLERLTEEAKAGRLTALAIMGITDQGSLIRSWMSEHDAAQRILLQGLLADTLTAVGSLPIQSTDSEPDDDGAA